MRLTRCPACRALTLDTTATCSCGLDLQWVRAELQRLQHPSHVIPLAPFRRLSKTSRRALAKLLR